jgi:hypothetical protein
MFMIDSNNYGAFIGYCLMQLINILFRQLKQLFHGQLKIAARRMAVGREGARPLSILMMLRSLIPMPSASCFCVIPNLLRSSFNLQSITSKAIPSFSNAKINSI